MAGNRYKGTVLVTGGNGNIGSATVNKFAEEGFKVYSTDITTPSHIWRENVHYIFMDAAKAESITRALKIIKKEDQLLSHVITAHGGSIITETKTGVESLPMKVWEESLRINLTSHFLVLKYSVPLLEKGSDEKGSSMTFISSINAIQGFGLAAYSAAKAGLSGLVTATAHDLGEKGIRINAILPGTTPSERVINANKETGTLDIYLQEFGSMTALGKLGTADAVAEMIYAIALNPMATGQNWILDCGQSIYRRGLGSAKKNKCEGIKNESND